MNIFKKIAFSNKKNKFFLSPYCLLFSTLKKSPPSQGEVRQGSRKSASEVKEKCVGGQGEVRQGSRKSASGVNEKCFRLMCGIQLKHFSLPLTHFSLTPADLENVTIHTIRDGVKFSGLGKICN